MRDSTIIPIPPLFFLVIADSPPGLSLNMSVGAYGLSNHALVYLALLQGGIQGVLVTLLLKFLSSRNNHPAWLKTYVVFANALTAAQTAIHAVQALEGVDSVPPRNELVLAAPVLTGLISASVQPYFIHRCWRIYQRRVILTIPLVLLWMTSWISAIMIGVFLSQAFARPPSEATPGVDISNLPGEVWSFSSLAFDTITTLSTTLYLFRVRKELSVQQSVLVVVWQVLWASAGPPLILAIISIVDGYMIPGSPRVIGVIAIAMMGKINILSLMINIVGQERIRQQFERRWTTPSPPRETWFQKQANRTSRSDWPAVHVTVHAETIELATVTESVSSNMKRGESSKGNLGNSVSDTASFKRDETGPDYVAHDLQLSNNQGV
ncbi:unnamed protein product [Rhizoctonia solani]|uniref:Uncharacterized protein n=1 Tax=Rhizoctonia solani TaxID=456999 RepID=A0A8H2XPI7_9AGAM|nr:unnamed protein product [Rhizoctonia solani]